MTTKAPAALTPVPDATPPITAQKPGKDSKADTSKPITDKMRPEKKAKEEIDFTSPALYLNRELTWLEFNRRVLNEAQDSRTPLLERIKFMAIVSSNLDEFFMKRIGGLKQQVGAGVRDLTVDGRTPLQQIEECCVVVREIEAQKDALLPKLLKALREHGIHVVAYDSLKKDEQKELRIFI